MKNETNPSGPGSELRNLAEEKARGKTAQSREDVEAMSPEEVRQMLHELQVHKIELEMQNEELRRSQVELEVVQARYFDLYNLAPVGYVTITGEGLISEANLTTADLLGVVLAELIMRPLSRWILKTDQDTFYHHKKRLFATGEQQVVDLRMVRDGTAIWVRLTAAIEQDEGDSPLCRIVLTDITDHKRSEEHLKIYQNMVSTMLDRMAFVDTNYRYIVANQAYEGFSSVSPEDLIGLRVAENLGEEMFQRTIKPHLDKCLQGEMVNYQEWFDYPSLGRRYVDVSYYPYRDDCKSIVGIVSHIKDITERKQAEDALEKSEAKYRAAFTLMRMLCDNVPDMIWAKDIENRYVFANKAICRNLLNTVDTNEPMGKVDMFFAERERSAHPDNPEWHTFGEICRDTDAITMDAGRPQQFDEYGNVRGEFLFLDVRKAPFLDENGRMIGTVGSARDVTATKEMERRLQNKEALLQAMLRNLPFDFWARDNSQHIIIQSNKSVDLWGDLMHNPMAEEQLDEKTLELWKSNNRRVLAGESISEECTLVTGSGEPRQFHNIVVPILNEAETLGILGLNIDITERKQTEEALRTLLAEKDVLLREVHHRVKNNMAAIIGLFNLQRQAMHDPQVETILGELSSRVRAMSLVHEKLYRSSSLARIDFQDYLQSLISHLRTSFGSPGIQCTIDAPGVEMPLDLAVPCGMIINELVSNALKYAFSGKQSRVGEEVDRILIVMHHDNDTFTLTVADNGVGLPPGFDLSTVKTLGLVLVRMLGRHQLGGRYQVDQVGGTRFTLTFSLRNKGKKHD